MTNAIEPFRLDERVAIVTGAGSGLGRAYALSLASRGAKVLVNDLSSDAAENVAAEIRELGGSAASDSTSVASVTGGALIVDHAVAEFGRVDILVNNAGNMPLSSFAKLDVSTIGETLDVHLGAAYFVTQPAYRLMAANGYGRIVFTSSGIGAFGIYGADVYASAKGGIVGLMMALRLECERLGIKINAVAPMATTRMSGPDLYSALPSEYVGPEHVAPVVDYFTSEQCRVNGEVWSVGAGAIARIFTARSEGYFKHAAQGAVTPEDIDAHLADIRTPRQFTEPPNWPEEWQGVLRLYGK